MTTEAFDPIELLARLNPISSEQLDELAYAAERETTFAQICAQRRSLPVRRRRSPRLRLVGVVVVVALALPALAFSGVLGSLFGFSNRGTPASQADLSHAGAVLNLTGASPGSFVQLAVRDGWAVYGARAPGGGFCFYTAPAGRTDGLGGGCDGADFPSPARPVVDMSLFALAPGAGGPSVQRLTGVAADGVDSVQVLALADCHVVATAPVVDNVYVTSDLPMIPEAQIVARGVSGNAVWHESVGPAANTNSCGLG